MAEGLSEEAIASWRVRNACKRCGNIRGLEDITVPNKGAFDGTSHLAFSDVSMDQLDNLSTMRIKITSKTHPFQVGIDIFVGRTGNTICPVTAMLEFLVARGAKSGPLFVFQDGRPLTRSRFVDKARNIPFKAGVDSFPYSGHSFRSGAATTAARQGVGDATIKMLGRWKTDAYQLYIKMPREQQAAISKKLVHGMDP